MHSQGAAESGLVGSAKDTPRAIRGDSGSSWRRLPLLLARLERDDLPTDSFRDKRLRKDAPDGDAAALLVLLLKGFERSKAGGVTGGVVPKPVAKRPSSRRRGDGGSANVTAVVQDGGVGQPQQGQVSVAPRGHAREDVRRLGPGCACVCTLKRTVVGDRIKSYSGRSATVDGVAVTKTAKVSRPLSEWPTPRLAIVLTCVSGGLALAALAPARLDASHTASLQLWRRAMVEGRGLPRRKELNCEDRVQGWRMNKLGAACAQARVA